MVSLECLGEQKKGQWGWRIMNVEQSGGELGGDKVGKVGKCQTR